MGRGRTAIIKDQFSAIFGNRRGARRESVLSPEDGSIIRYRVETDVPNAAQFADRLATAKPTTTRTNGPKISAAPGFVSANAPGTYLNLEPTEEYIQFYVYASSREDAKEQFLGACEYAGQKPISEVQISPA